MVTPTVMCLCLIFSIIPSIACLEETGICVMELVSHNVKMPSFIVNETDDYIQFRAHMQKEKNDRINEMMPMHCGSGKLYILFRSYIFVDKTLFVQEILETPSRVIRITGPKRIGKSVNLNMLERFLMIEVDENGNPAKYDNTTGYYMFHKATTFDTYNMTKRINPPLLISKNKDIMDKYQGRYPVVRLDVLVDPLDFLKFVNTMKYELAATFELHKYMVPVLERKLQQNPNDSDTEFKLNRFKLYLDAKSLNIRELELTEGVNFLCRVLKDHFNKRPFVLIDDIRLVSSHVLMEKKVKQRKKVLEFYRKLYHDTIQAEDLHTKVVITGLLKLANFAKVKDCVDVILLRPNKFTPFFGFKRNEVENIFEIMNMTAELRIQALQHFKGLPIGQYQMYNAHTIVEFTNAKKIKAYWNTFTSISVDLTDKFSVYKAVRNCLHNLVYGHPMEVELRNMEVVDDDEQPVTVNSVLRFFVAYGYFALTPVSETVDRISCVNEEMRSILKLDLISYIRSTMFLEPFENIPDILGEQFLLLFNDRNTTSKKLCGEFKKYLGSLEFDADFTKKWDLHEKELLAQITLNDYIHDMILYLLSLVEKSYYSNPKNKHKFNIKILEAEVSEEGKMTNRTYTVVNYGNRGVLLEAKFNYSEPLSKIFDQIDDYSPYFHPHGYPVEVAKHIVVNIFESRAVNIMAKCFNLSIPIITTPTTTMAPFICAHCGSSAHPQ